MSESHLGKYLKNSICLNVAFSSLSQIPTTYGQMEKQITVDEQNIVISILDKMHRPVSNLLYCFVNSVGTIVQHNATPAAECDKTQVDTLLK